MKESLLSFAEGFTDGRGQRARQSGAKMLTFNWDEAAAIIKDRLKTHPDLKAEAGLQGDWCYTGGSIFEKSFPTNDEYTYLSSNWAKPTLILSWDIEEREEIQCFIERDLSRFDSDSKWDSQSLEILGIPLRMEPDGEGIWGDGAPGSGSYLSLAE